MAGRAEIDGSASDSSSEEEEGVELLERKHELEHNHDEVVEVELEDASGTPREDYDSDDEGPIYTTLDVLEMATGQLLSGPCPEGRSCDKVPRGLPSLCCCVVLLVLGLVVVQQAWFVSALSKLYGSIYGGPVRATCARLQNETALFATRRPPLATPPVAVDGPGTAAHVNATLRHSPPPVLYTIPGSGSTWVRLLVVSWGRRAADCVASDHAWRKESTPRGHQPANLPRRLTLPPLPPSPSTTTTRTT